MSAAEDESLLDLLEEDLIAEHAQTHELATLRSEMMHQGRQTGPS
jgi:hypothetical protein